MCTWSQQPVRRRISASSSIYDVYEIYWNGVQVAHNGGMPPHDNYPYRQAVQTFDLGPVRDGVLAVRVWKAPLDSFDTGLNGGFAAAPLIGNGAAIADRKTVFEYHWLHSRQYFFGLDSLYGLVVVLGLLAWLRARSERVLLWMSLYSLAPLLTLFLVGMRLPMSYGVALGWLQPVHGLADLSLWFLLLSLLRLTENRPLVRVTVALAYIDMTANILDGALTMVSRTNPLVVHWEQAADAFLTIFETVPEILPLIIVFYGLRKKDLDAARWLVSIFAAVTSLISNLAIAFSQGSRYTHWTLANTIRSPIFSVNENPFTAATLADTGLLLSIIYAVYCYIRENSARQGAIEQELRSARELQQVLIPETLPSLPGYAVTSAYRPAQEVGGDFFQVIPGIGPGSGSTLVVVGDVSGKGLRAAMTVSLIVGTLRTLAEYSSRPAEILAGLNRRLQNRLHGGFATCVILRLDPDGSCVLANAGHPSPFLNQHEIEIPGALPLGVAPDTVYEETSAQLQVGDHLFIYTDGLLEARSAAGELFSFERLSALAASHPNAEQATVVAQDFGQDDDITVLTLTRLAEGEKSSTLLTAPSLALSPA
jgi:hypothetical protein